MLPELGHFALILALCVALVQGIVPLVGASRGIAPWVALARPAALAQFLFLALALGALVQAFIANDFSVLYVAQNSNTALPLPYRISATWGGHEGSLLLWGVMLGGWTAAVGLLSRRLPELMVARVIAILGLVSTGFLAFMLFTSNPFERLPIPPVEGRDLNPLLQDPGLVLHPPTLYMGYVGFSVAFAFAIAALLSGRLDAAWARWSRPWTIVAWSFLTVGIALGSWWAYYELGWGGWWFWDPVENASLLPWLVGTALMHSLAVSEKRSAFKSWTVLLAISAFSLSLLGTFLVRSGVLTSVHAFASDPTRGVFILILLAAVVGSSLLIYAVQAPKVKSTGQFKLVSRETLMLGNNIVLTVSAASVLLGTLYPLILDALGVGKISVGAPYFNTVFIPLMAPLAVAIGIGPLVRWKQDSPGRIVALLWRFMLISAVAAVLIPLLAYGNVTPLAALGVGLAVWLFLSALVDLRRRLTNKGWGGFLTQPPAYYGMVAGHLGVAATILGVTLTSNYSQERDVRMAPGDSVELGGYSFRFESLSEVPGPNYLASTAEFRVSRNEAEVAVLRPEKRQYMVQTMPMTEAGIDWGFSRDLYIALGESLDDGAWAVRLQYKPFIRWIWLGGLLMAFGGLLAAADRRYRLAAHQERTAMATPLNVPEVS